LLNKTEQFLSLAHKVNASLIEFTIAAAVCSQLWYVAE
jgi:hypothetical protein